MTLATELPHLTACGYALDRSPERLGFLESSIDLLDDPSALRRRMDDDGYLFLPGFLDARQVLEVRADMLQRLARDGALRPGTDPADALAVENHSKFFYPEYAGNNTPLLELLYSGRLISFFQDFFAEPVRHFDFTWIRAMGPGQASRSHCDSVYMNRGTSRLYTVWTPLGHVGYDLGGLMILGNSNNNERLKQTYCRYDVDTYCENRPEIQGWKRGGTLGENPNQIQRSLGGRWLTTQYAPGDVLIFSIYTVHASTDNHTDRVRLSTDTRYQPAGEPADERWIGANPIAHGQAGKRGRVC